MDHNPSAFRRLHAAQHNILAKEVGIMSEEDLLYYFPAKYVDRSQIYTLRQLYAMSAFDDGATSPYVQLKGYFTQLTVQQKKDNPKKRFLKGVFTDGTGSTVECLWFQRVDQLLHAYLCGQEYLLFASFTLAGNTGLLSCVHPELDRVRPESDPEALKGLRSVYPVNKAMSQVGITSRLLRYLVDDYLTHHPEPFPETLPDYLVQGFALMPYNQAIRQIHFPASQENVQRARHRLLFEKYLYMQLNLLQIYMLRKQGSAGFVFNKIGKYFNDYYHYCIPYVLTEAQKRVIREIKNDMQSGQQMNRLLQGDVGSGKTMVATLAMLIALDNGYQACLIAPTEILATQHYETLSVSLARVGVRCALLTGSTKTKERRVLHEGLQDGTIQVLIGTHAVFEDTVRFQNLGLAIIDEQHRFGVAQRATLWRKNTYSPHVLVMTATPIPRTLAMTLYCDLDVSVIDELPPGRKPIFTTHYEDTRRGPLYTSMRRELDKGRQIYVVYPLVKKNEKFDYTPVEDGFYEMQAAFGPQYHVAMVHGQMKPADKAAAMERFSQNQAQILVATTVIEVGVNVPNASVMIIFGAERFSLAQLHQLRGRVGRGAEQSYCVLVTQSKKNYDEEDVQGHKTANRRIQVMCETNDGFRIAEEDLKLRGAGDVIGTRQSGTSEGDPFQPAYKDLPLLNTAQQCAKKILQADLYLTHPENALLARRLQTLYKERVDWSMIS